MVRSFWRRWAAGKMSEEVTLRRYAGLGIPFCIPLSLLVLCVIASGCTRFARLAVDPGGCVNPASGLCPSNGAAGDSRILEVRFYQLKEPVQVCKLDFNAFLDGKDLDVLKSALADTQQLDLVRKTEFLEQGKSRTLSAWRLFPSTRFVLAVALGRSRSKNSLRQMAASQITSETHVYVRGTDLCLVRPCEINMESECP